MKRKASKTKSPRRVAPATGSAAFTEPPPKLDVNDPQWADEFSKWAQRKAESMDMDAIEMMGRALGLKKEADEWRARQKRNRDIEADGNKIYGKATTLRADCSKCSWVGTFYGEPHEAEKRIADAHAAARHGNCNGILTLTPSVPPNSEVSGAGATASNDNTKSATRQRSLD